MAPTSKGALVNIPYYYYYYCFFFMSFGGDFFIHSWQKRHLVSLIYPDESALPALRQQRLSKNV